MLLELDFHSPNGYDECEMVDCVEMAVEEVKKSPTNLETHHDHDVQTIESMEIAAGEEDRKMENASY